MHRVHQIAVIAPVLRRPKNAAPLARSLAASPDLARLVFVCSPGDREQIRACETTGCETMVVGWPPGRADWALKLDYAYARTTEPYLLLGADDIRFHPGWAQAVLREFAADSRVGMVGTNDLANPLVRRGGHSTHPVVSRIYVDDLGTIDQPGRVAHDGYFHNWVDNELVQTAMARGAWVFAKDAHVEHLHPIWRTAPDDETYRRGQEHYREDQRLFQERKKLWAP